MAVTAMSDMKARTTVGGIAALALALGAVLGGCNADPTKNYTLASQYPDDVRTVAVQIFTRGPNVYRRGLEFRLTEAVIKHIELNTNYKVVDKEHADTEMTGTITGVSQRTMSMVKDVSNPREKEVLISASMQWQDLRSGDVLRRSKVRAAGSYIPLEPFEEDFFQGSEDAIDKLARRIVEEMENEW